MNIQFTTKNVDGEIITRQFRSVNAIADNWLSENCDLPANDDEVLEFRICGVPIVGCKQFEDVLSALGVAD